MDFIKEWGEPNYWLLDTPDYLIVCDTYEEAKAKQESLPYRLKIHSYITPEYGG